MTKAEKTRQFIIEKAAPILNKKGMAGTAISDIMEATHLAKGGVYGNFENKDEICLEAFNYLTQSIAAEINRRVAEKTTAKEKLFALLDFYPDRLGRPNSGGCPILNFGAEADDTNPVIRQKVMEAINSSQNRIAGIAQQGVNNGEFKPGFDAADFARKAFTMIEGAILISRVKGSTGHVEWIVGILKAEINENSF